MSDNLEAKIRYLEMIQSIMTRMSANSFMLKGWAVTLAAGIFALASREMNKTFFLIAYVPIIVFWFLDAYYLQIERQYKHLFALAAKRSPETIDFTIERPKPEEDHMTTYSACLFSRTEVWFYLPTALLIAIVIIISSIA